MTSFIEVSGDILASTAEAIAIPVNCVGVMGKGLALDAAKRWPSANQHYRQLCDLNAIKTDGPTMSHKLTDGPFILFFATKNHWRNASEYSYIRDGLRSLKDWIIDYDIKHIALPKLGCGLGGLKWSSVQRIIWEELTGISDLQVDIYI